MNQLLASPEAFADPQFWKKFYETGQKLDWYGNIQEYIPLFKLILKTDHKILQIGCGNAASEYALYDEGFTNIHSIDIDEKLIKQRIEDNGTKVRPGLTFACEDATKLSAEDNSFGFVFDKGTLDALFPPNPSEAEVAQVDKMFDEAIRVLKPNSKYIIITLAQEHILRHISKYYETRNDVFLYFYTVEVSDSSGSLIPAGIVQFIKLKQAMPEGLNKRMKLITNPQTNSTFTVTIDDLLDIFNKQRSLALFANQCSRPLHYVARITLKDSKTKKERWSFMLKDRKIPAYTWAFLIIPPDHGFDLDDEMVSKLADQTNYDRVILAEQLPDNDFSDMNKVTDDLQEVSYRFRPMNSDALAEMAWCFSDDKTCETKVDCGETPLLGAYSVFNIDNSIENATKIIRRLIFESSPDIVQTDVEVSKLNKNDKEFKKVNTLYLSGLYQRMMIAAMEFRPGGLVESLKKSYNFAVLGVGGGTLVTFLHTVYKESKVTAVELHPELYDVARKWFGYPKDDERLISIGRDALEWTKDDQAGTYDFIFVDVSGANDGFTTCPGPEFVEPEFVPCYKKRLAKHGMLVMNIVSRDHKFIKQVVKAMSEHFKFMCMGLPGDPTNEIMIASDSPFSRARNYAVMRRNLLPAELSDVYEMPAKFETYAEKKSDENDFLPAHVLLNQKSQKKKPKQQNRNKKSPEKA